MSPPVDTAFGLADQFSILWRELECRRPSSSLSCLEPFHLRELFLFHIPFLFCYLFQAFVHFFNYFFCMSLTRIWLLDVNMARAFSVRRRTQVGSVASSAVRQTRWPPRRCPRTTDVSSDQMTFFQSSRVQCWWALQNSSLFCFASSDRPGFQVGLTLLNPCSFKTR